MPKIVKVPMLMQMEVLECGAAALGMVLAYYGKWVSLEQLRIDCGVSRDGSSVRNIVHAARGYGLEAKAYRMELAALRQIPLPAIIHWNLSHFVVLNGFKKDQAIINDPARGTVEISMEEFDKMFSGIVLRLQKTAKFLQGGKPRSVWKFAMSRMKGSSGTIVFLMLVSALIAMTSVVMPLFSKIFMDNILSGKNVDWLNYLIVAMVVAVSLHFSLQLVQSLYWLRVSGRFAITANAEFVWHVLHLPMEFFGQRWAGEIAARQGTNEQICGTLVQKIAPVLVNLALLIFYLAIMLKYSLALTLIGLLAVAINVLVIRFKAKKMMNLSRAAQAASGKLSGVTTSSVEMIEMIKSAGAEAGFYERWAGYYSKNHNAQVAVFKYSKYYGMLPSILQRFTNIAILMVGVYLIMDGVFTIGMLLAFQSFLASFLSPVNQLVELEESFITMRARMERVEDVLNYPVDSTGTNDDINIKAGKLSGDIAITDLTFGYNKFAEPLIKNFSIRIKPGSFVAIVGTSGCGKSTLAKLMTGLYRPWQGEILFDGKKREKIDEYVYKSSVAMVDQDIILFEDTVADNIRMWDASIDDFAVILAARDADMHDVVVSRPDGYAQMIQEGGRNFSGGQKQRLEIARVLAGEPTIIILDEATSALDAKTEAMVMQNIRNLGVTCVVIAHRLSTIRDCDEILVLQKGMVIERGTHDELYCRGGKYAELVSMD